MPGSASGWMGRLRAHPAVRPRTPICVTAIDKIYAALGTHGEANGSVRMARFTGRRFDRVPTTERVFVEARYRRWCKRVPAELKVVFGHITTAEAAQFVMRAAGSHVAATVTARHAAQPQRDLRRRHPPATTACRSLKRESHRGALIATGHLGATRAFSQHRLAPHARSLPENACGCAGCHRRARIETHAEVFDDRRRARSPHQAFASLSGPAFYGLAPSSDTITLRRRPWSVPASYPYLGEDPLVPRAGEQVSWKLVEGA